MHNLERRYAPAEIRVSKSGRRASGYVMRWNTKSKPSSGLPFTEICAERCCTNALRTGDPLLLLDHQTSLVLGRQSAKTVRFSEDNSGLEFDCELPNSPLGDNVAESLRRGDLQSCSFGFSMDPDMDPDCESWEDGEDESGERCVVRTLRQISKLHEASIVSSPAYPGTSASVRSLFPEGVPVSVELRSRLHGRYNTAALDAFYRSQADKWAKVIAEDEAKERHDRAVRLRNLYL